MTTLDAIDTLHTYAEKRGYQVQLHAFDSGWLVRLVDKEKNAKGEAKGRSPKDAHEALIEKLHIGD